MALSRRQLLKSSAAGVAAGAAGPFFIRDLHAEDTIKIAGIHDTSGGLDIYGKQMVATLELAVSGSERLERDDPPAVTVAPHRSGVLTLVCPDIEDEVARRNVGDEVDHLGPWLDPCLGVGLRDPVIRRPNVCLGPAHTGDETIPGNKVSVRARGTRDESPRRCGVGCHRATGEE